MARNMVFPAVLLIFFLVVIAIDAAVLPLAEVNALREIGDTLGKRNWDFSVDPCTGFRNWIAPNTTKDNTNAVTCDCSFLNNTVCHVVSIILKVQNLSGILPPTLTKLPFLKELDLTRNFLSGPIPKEWGSTQLVNISLIGNQISGPIPREFGNISTLENVTLEYNQLSGAIPPELGNLSNIERLSLMSNYLTGPLPPQLARLTTIKEFRISDNQLNGSIPSFIQNWPNLQKLFIQASGLSGPIPLAIGTLANLTDLRISNLNGNGSSFPPISGLTKLTRLILRSCNITGQLPDYLSTLTKLKLLDLSFNKLTGPIPSSYSALSETDFIFLSGNSLSGEVPDWVVNKGDVIDLSYNNFSGSAASANCAPRKTNLFAGTSQGNTLGMVSCMSSHQCSKSFYSLKINCGGRQATADDGTVYEEDMDSGGPSKFVQSRSNWALSTTGNVLDNDLPSDTYIANSSAISGKNADLYRNARLSPLSLTYYGFCLGNGNYTVNLHFAEVMFTADRTYASLGRRFFDIYIQGKLVKKDFNIEDEAGGVYKPIVRNFTAVVNNGTLDIRFFWAGKGTNGIPIRGVYGPLISAISVDPDFEPPSENGNSLSVGAIVGIVIGVVAAISVVPLILWWIGCFENRDTLEYELRGLDLQTGSFTLRQIKAATKNFDPANKIGEGGFGSVFKGDLGDGNIIAVKQLSSKSKQGNREFVNEIGMISALQHPNLVKLYGCCIEGNQLLLIYEYLENNSLARALFGAEKHQIELNWATRHKIAIAIARGLAYLHEESRLKIVHRDIKATNVLLDKDLNPKISDFGLAKLDDEENTHISTRIAGTFGYMAPEYAMRGYLTDKADVYSYGVVLLEIVSGRSNTSISPKEDCFYILDWANQLKEEGNLIELIDPRLGSNYNEDEALRALEVGLMCANVSPTDRPNMSSVVSMLEGQGGVDKKFVSDTSGSSKKKKVKPLDVRTYEELLADRSQVSTDVPFTGSSTSTTGDLYPITMGTEYLENRL